MQFLREAFWSNIFHSLHTETAQQKVRAPHRFSKRKIQITQNRTSPRTEIWKPKSGFRTTFERLFQTAREGTCTVRFDWSCSCCFLWSISCTCQQLCAMSQGNTPNRDSSFLQILMSDRVSLYLISSWCLKWETAKRWKHDFWISDTIVTGRPDKTHRTESVCCWWGFSSQTVACKTSR